jgi:hypothetical protein
MKRTLFFFLICCAANAVQAQVYKADTAFTTDPGAGGAPASCAFTGSINSTYGLNHNRNFFFLLAEDFTVPSGQTWNLDTVILYSYQTGSGTTSTINFASLEIRQGSVTGTSVFGDTTTNRLTSSSWTGIYRVDKNALTGTTRPIMRMKIKITPTKTLTAGTYWLIWGAQGSGTGGVFCPPKVSPGRINPSGQNAMQHAPVSGGIWHAASDTISGPTPVTVGFNYILKGPQKPSGVGTMSAELNALEQNQPNPFTGQTRIAFEFDHSVQAKLSVYNSLGQLVRVIFDGPAQAGRTEATFDANGLAAGIYYYRLVTEEGTQTMSMTLK